jgi:hypothetical protein
MMVATPSHITCHTPDVGEDEEGLGEKVKVTIRQKSSVSDLSDVEISTEIPLRHSMSTPLSNCFRKLDPPGWRSDGAENTPIDTSEPSSPFSTTSSIEPLASLLTWISIETEDEDTVADEMADFAARVSALYPHTTIAAKVTMARWPA